MWDKIKQIISPLAPVLGGMLGGPAGAAAGTILKKTLLGTENASDEELLLAAENITPEQQMALKQAEYNYEISMAQIAYADRANARNMQATTKSNVPAIMTFFLTGVVVYMFTVLAIVDIDQDVKHILELLTGQTMTLLGGFCVFWSGSTFGSQIKTTLLGKS